MQTNLSLLWHPLEADLKKFIYRRVKDKALTEDIAQDVFLKVSARKESLRDKKKARSWIFMIARNAVMDHFRRQARTLHPNTFESENEAVNFNDCVAGYLKKLVKAIPDKYREAIEQVELGSFSQTHLAAHLNISLSGAKSRVQRGRALLRKRLEETLLIETDPYGNIISCRSRQQRCCCD